MLQRYKKANRLQVLSKEEKQNPQIVIDAFFDGFHLMEVRKQMWDWLCSALGNQNSWHETGFERGNLLFLYENLQKLTEAAYILHQKEQHKKKKPGQ